MGNKYSYEFNRSFPDQTEGPEISPYVNKKSPRKKISITAAAVLATMAVAVVVVVVLSSPLGFYVDNVNQYSADLYFEATSDAGFSQEDIISYRILCFGENVSEGTLPHQKGTIPISDLLSDTYYTVKILRNGEVIKTINFRTLPERSVQPDKPTRQPAKTPRPAVTPTSSEVIAPTPTTKPTQAPTAVITPSPTPTQAPTAVITPSPTPMQPTVGRVIFTQQEGTYDVQVTTSIIPNDAVITSVELDLEGKQYSFRSQGNNYTLLLSGLPEGEHTSVLVVKYTINGEEYTHRSNHSLTVERVYTPMEFVSVDATQSLFDYSVTLNLKINLNDSEITNISVTEDGEEMPYTRDGYTLYIPKIGRGTHTMTVSVEYTTNGVSASAEKTATVTVVDPFTDMVVESFQAYYYDNTIEFEQSFELNDAENVSAVLSSLDKSYTAVVDIPEDADFFQCHAENTPALKNDVYEIYDVDFSYTINGVALEKNVKVLVVSSAVQLFPGYLNASVKTTGTENEYLVALTPFFDYADMIDIKTLEIYYYEYSDTGIFTRLVYSHDLSGLEVSDLNAINPTITLNSDEKSGEFILKLIYLVDGYEFYTETWFMV